MMLRILAAVLLALTLAACNPLESLSDGLRNSEAVATELEQSLGVKSFVVFNIHNGTLTSVTVTFESVPAHATLPEIAAKTRSAVLKAFKQTPGSVLISFKA
ncbi:hypothetical protein [Leeia aquatica]|uniref:Lipoprotein n=1 Tax=Leeia aquatica TaxID=2725557 RepID=A0A847S632_9NEIS|nr:hypothetical protein [Leeia aquatica]NLR74265.1 hypothetical protein [Leeia aquatica]